MVNEGKENKGKRNDFNSYWTLGHIRKMNHLSDMNEPNQKRCAYWMMKTESFNLIMVLSWT